MSMAELGRLTAIDATRVSLVVPADAETLVIENGLGAVIYGSWGDRPTLIEWDFAVPGSALFALPIVGGSDRLNLLVAYPGAVPATDVQAIVWTSRCTWGPFVGAIA